ncbi:MAG: polyprenyl synthetase family protein [Ignavibacteriota bacterium]
MAFQLVDDVLDFTAREKTLGKPVGGDLREGKVTLPLCTPWSVRRRRNAVWWKRSCATAITKRCASRKSSPYSKNIAASSASRNAPKRSPTRPVTSLANSPTRPTNARC